MLQLSAYQMCKFTGLCRPSTMREKGIKAAAVSKRPSEVEEGVAFYEEAPRKHLAEGKPEKKPAARLPVKTPEGQLVYHEGHVQPALPKVGTLNAALISRWQSRGQTHAVPLMGYNIISAFLEPCLLGCINWDLCWIC